MKSEEEFDELMRNKFSTESDFPFEEDKWARMEEMIMADEAKKKRRKFFLIYFSGFITAILIFIPIYWYETNNNSKRGVEKTTNKKNIQASSKSVNIDSKNEDLNPSNESNGQKGKVNDSIRAEQKSTLIADKTKTVMSPNEKTYTEKNQTNVSPRETNINLKNKSVKKLNSSTSTNNSQKRRNTQNKQENITNRKQNESVTLKDEASNQVTKTDSSATKTNTEPWKTNEIVTSNVTLDSAVIAKKDSVAEQKNNISEIEKPDSLIQDTTFTPKFTYFLNLGTQYNLGFSEFHDGNSLSPYIGGSFQYQFSKNWAFNSGLGIYMLYNFAFEKIITQKTYDFGFREQMMNIVPEHMYYLTTSFEMCRIVNKNSFAFGLQPSFLVANLSHVSTNEYSSLNFSDLKSIHSFKHGYGLNYFDLQLSLTYSRYLNNNKWLVGGTCGIGLLDVRKKSWTENSTFERNQFVRFNLIYKIK